MAPQIIKVELLMSFLIISVKQKLLIWHHEICVQFSKSMQFLISLNMQIRSCYPLEGYRTACNLAIQKLLEMAVDLKDKSMEEKRSMLIRCAETTLNSKCLGC